MSRSAIFQIIAFGIAAIALFACVLAGVKAIGRASDTSKLGDISDKPEPMTVSQLIARGPEGNAHVEISNYSLDDRVVVRKTRSAILHMWIPVRPADQSRDDNILVLAKAGSRGRSTKCSPSGASSSTRSTRYRTRNANSCGRTIPAPISTRSSWSMSTVSRRGSLSLLT